MRQRPLGSDSVTELALGTWGLSGDGYGPVAELEQDRVIDRALAMGIRVFETADCYGEGAMERRLGERLPSDGSAFVVTKVGTRRDVTPQHKDFSVTYLREAIERCRERLKRETLDCVLLHNPSHVAFERHDIRGLFAELVEQRVVRTWGASVGLTEAGRAALGSGAQVLELAYNVFHTQEFADLGIEVRLRNVSLLARSVLSHGLLCGLWAQHKEFASYDHRGERWNSDEFRHRIFQLGAVRTLLSSELPTLRSVALRFALANEAFSTVVLGPRSCLQLDQLVREAGKEPPYLEPQRLSELRERLSGVGVYQ